MRSRRYLTFGLAISGVACAAIGLKGSPTSASNDQVDLAAHCSQLVGKQFQGAQVNKAEFVAAGSKLAPYSDKMAAAFCRADATIAPSQNSQIKIQIWLPTDWNGKFLGVGGGGFDGGYASASLGLRAAVTAGYAALATNAGHDASPDPKWALGNPEKIADYGHRANHLGAMVGKAVISGFYGKPANLSYFSGCSNGGRDALMLAQRYPDDYDAIIAGAPANDFTGLMASFVRIGKLSRRPGVDLIPAKLNLVHDAAVAKCDAIDGLKDGLIGRPNQCSFNPAVLQCKNEAGTGCLSLADVQVVQDIYRGTYSATGKLIMPGLPVGSEYEWSGWLTSSQAAGPSMGKNFYRNMVIEDRDWETSAFELDRDYVVARTKVGPVIDATNANLRPFFKKGGKLLIYHGWDDAAIPAGNTLNYYAALKRATGKFASKQTRLFMLPGVSHCSGGHGPGSVDYLAALDKWMASGRAPNQLVADKPENPFRAMGGLPTKSLLSRPICAWPKIAKYKGSGPVTEASSFTCK